MTRVEGPSAQPRAGARSAKNPKGLLGPSSKEAWAAFALAWIDGWEDVSPTADRLATARLWFEHVLDDESAAEADRKPDAISPSS